ncbi:MULTISPECIES: galactan 5-O-arabinofuranosyltransferase [Mycobacterium avium complex (MAC)]|uniref:Galactan 5-O-arabinofuranosyltransferase n=1 Tax=Mycobacterium bouchedurhonense TaxID=701041 RepID=A0AAW5S7R9_MYCBC|nr:MULTISPECIES: galactan 5-O-arabinofuranosyltransferase [Mycobacterium avium complex (MAC)]KDP02840.1 arabinofuranosyltransferase [Mycobacterium avium subsp. hominissuis 3388]MBZ4535434.1 arabinofuranosyltransferase [Mycobacterium avium subsp. hominissuis]MBZ4576957.1 arabinofuranosyltransferase [Mycobacterium avium subsp. hominissuis]MBZ4592052.1 arabinofuranosyltransferase [Mycobacterium avium subsp. hominissuis]MBZ4604872.1 arabinofuranosyltransferase [Mycobacterium avium subsp. hominissu
MRSALATLGQMAVAVLVAVVVAVVSLTAIAGVQWPAFPSSNQLHALTTVGQVGCLAGLVAVGWVWHSFTGRVRRLAQLGGLVFVSAFTVVTLGMPLGATKLYLFGISVDQQFRTEYLTRLADSPALRDMTYLGLPPFYPPGWFWIGGRAAALSGTPAWEVFKPWAITSITVAVAVALVLWWRMVRFEYALIVTTATAAVTLAYGSPEPYSAMITVLLPPMLVLTWSGLRAGECRAGGMPETAERAAGGAPGSAERAAGQAPGSAERETNFTVDAERETNFTLAAGEASVAASETPRSGWAAVVGAGLFLGFTATWYTLLFGFTAFAVGLMALWLAGLRWRRHGVRAALEPLRRLAVIVGIAVAIGCTTWLPFLARAARNPVSNTGSAQHYLPADGAELTFPMLQFTLLGVVCMAGTLWLVLRARASVRAGALAIGVLAVYLWSLLSMLTTLARTTLLSFRLQPTLSVLLVAAGAFGLVEAALALRRRSRAVIPVAGAIGLAAAIAFSQDIPDVLRPDLTIAYTDTDGHGQRGDRRPPSAEKFYASIDDVITRETGRPRDQTVVMTADYSFLSFYPYWGFQGLTSHYANPLAQFDLRAAQIDKWSKLKTADELLHALDTCPWPPPTVFLMRHGANNTYTLRLAEDVYPNQPNVRRYTVELRAALFDSPRFAVHRVGPFVLAVRKPAA